MFTTTFNKEEKLWSGCDLPTLFNPKISAAQALLHSMQLFGPKVAQICDNDGVSLTFDDIRIRTIRAAQNLQTRGFKPKQTFIILTGNSPNTAPITYAAFAIGCPIACINPCYGKSEIIRFMNITKPVAIFCDNSFYDTMIECLVEMKSEAKIFTFDGSHEGSEPIEHLLQETHKEDQFVPELVDGENDVAVIVRSSGTTGAAKAVRLSHAALLNGAVTFNISNSFTDVLLTFGSIFWISGLSMMVMGTLYGGARIITTAPFSPELQLYLIEKYKVTLALNPPHHIFVMMKSYRFSKTDLSSLKFQCVTGCKFPLHLKHEFSRQLPNCKTFVGYGMSELACALSIDYPASNEKDTVGQIASGIQVKVIDDNGNRCDVNVEGEICAKLNYKFLGYEGNQKATDEFLDEEGFMKTGDIGYFDDDGYLYLVDRKKDLLKYRSQHTSPSELESHLLKSKHIKLACVVGIPDAMGDLIAAAVVRTEGSNITEKDVYDLIADNFKDYSKLRGGVYFMDSFPMTPTGKVIRRQVTKTVIDLHDEHRCKHCCSKRFD